MGKASKLPLPVKHGPVSRRRFGQKDLVRFVELVQRVDGRIDEIARLMRRGRETVAYNYDRKMIKKGFVVQANADYQQLGLKRVVTTAKVGRPFARRISDMEKLLHNHCYVSAVLRRRPVPGVVIMALVPQQYVSDHRRAITDLKSLGVLEEASSTTFEWCRNIPMKGEFYDFEAEQWIPNWLGRLKAQERIPLAEVHASQLDYTDLFILKELQTDGRVRIVDVARKLKAKSITVRWHRRNHVDARKLINGYRMNWMLANPERQRYVYAGLLAHGLEPKQVQTISRQIGALPFAWSEAGNLGSYLALCAFPGSEFDAAMRYVGSILSEVGRSFEYFIFDSDDMPRILQETVPYEMFDRDHNSWRFSKEAIQGQLKKLAA